MSDAFNHAVSHAMKYEVGGFWNVNHPAVATGDISTAANRKAVGYVNDPTDLGGETKFGVAKNANPELDIKKLSWDAAKRVYYRKYWLAANCDDIHTKAPKLAVMHFDGAVNHGVGRAAIFLQTALGVPADGDIGPKTMQAVFDQCATPSGELALCEKIANQRIVFYNKIVANKPAQKKFLRGWLARIADISSFIKTM